MRTVMPKPGSNGEQVESTVCVAGVVMSVLTSFMYANNFVANAIIGGFLQARPIPDILPSSQLIFNGPALLVNLSLATNKSVTPVRSYPGVPGNAFIPV